MRFRQKSQNVDTVDVSPLIDMVFLLVVFFMLTTTFTKEEGIDISFSAGGKAEIAGSLETILIFIDADGQILLDGGEGNEDSGNIYMRDEYNYFREDLRNILRVNQNKQIQLYSSEFATVQDVITTIDQVQMAGGKNITFIDGDIGE